MDGKWSWAVTEPSLALGLHTCRIGKMSMQEHIERHHRHVVYCWVWVSPLPRQLSIVSPENKNAHSEYMLNLALSSELKSLLTYGLSCAGDSHWSLIYALWLHVHRCIDKLCLENQIQKRHRTQSWTWCKREFHIWELLMQNQSVQHWTNKLKTYTIIYNEYAWYSITIELLNYPIPNTKPTGHSYLHYLILPLVYSRYIFFDNSFWFPFFFPKSVFYLFSSCHFSSQHLFLSFHHNVFFFQSFFFQSRQTNRTSYMIAMMMIIC